MTTDAMQSCRNRYVRLARNTEHPEIRAIAEVAADMMAGFIEICDRIKRVEEWVELDDPRND